MTDKNESFSAFDTVDTAARSPLPSVVQLPPKIQMSLPDLRDLKNLNFDETGKAGGDAPLSQIIAEESAKSQDSISCSTSLSPTKLIRCVGNENISSAPGDVMVDQANNLYKSQNRVATAANSSGSLTKVFERLPTVEEEENFVCNDTYTLEPNQSVPELQSPHNDNNSEEVTGFLRKIADQESEGENREILKRVELESLTDQNETEACAAQTNAELPETSFKKAELSESKISLQRKMLKYLASTGNQLACSEIRIRGKSKGNTSSPLKGEGEVQFWVDKGIWKSDDEKNDDHLQQPIILSPISSVSSLSSGAFLFNSEGIPSGLVEIDKSPNQELSESDGAPLEFSVDSDSSIELLPANLQQLAELSQPEARAQEKTESPRLGIPNTDAHTSILPYSKEADNLDQSGLQLNETQTLYYEGKNALKKQMEKEIENFKKESLIAKSELEIKLLKEDYEMRQFYKSQIKDVTEEVQQKIQEAKLSYTEKLATLQKDRLKGRLTTIKEKYKSDQDALKLKYKEKEGQLREEMDKKMRKLKEKEEKDEQDLKHKMKNELTELETEVRKRKLRDYLTHEEDLELMDLLRNIGSLSNS